LHNANLNAKKESARIKKKKKKKIGDLKSSKPLIGGKKKKLGISNRQKH
jgi:hypothetical protein